MLGHAGAPWSVAVLAVTLWTIWRREPEADESATLINLRRVKREVAAKLHPRKEEQ